jgi:predicted nucleotidyltransferase
MDLSVLTNGSKGRHYEDSEVRVLMITTTACERFKKEPRILAAYLLGSAVHGTLRPDSDVDFGLLLQPGESLSALEINDLTSELTLDLERPVDVGLISAHNLIFARQCVLTGKQVFCRNVFRVGLIVATLLGLSMQLDFERREIVHAYTA